jgi:hypothetical protein
MRKFFILATITVLNYQQSIFSENNVNRNVIIDQDTIVLDTSLQLTSDEQILQHVELFKKISADWNSVCRVNSSLKKGSFRSKSFVFRERPETFDYRHLDKYNIESIYLVENSIPVRIEFKTSNPRIFTDGELNEYKKTGILPLSYKTLSEKMAIEKANNFLKNFYGKKYSGQYDSIHISINGDDYFISFGIKKKGNIVDLHCSFFEINVNTSEISSFSTSSEPFLNESDFNYTPKISKEQATQMFLNEAQKMQLNFRITNIMLRKDYGKAGEPYWAWYIYGKRENQEQAISSVMIINSETGEIIGKYL